MPIIKSQYTGSLRTSNTHEHNDEVLLTDAPRDNQGEGKYFSPTDLLASSYTTCVLTVMGIAARKLGVELNGLNAVTEKVMGANPRRISQLRVQVTLESTNATPEQVQEIKQAGIDCPVALSLHPEVKQDITFNF